MRGFAILFLAVLVASCSPGEAIPNATRQIERFHAQVDAGQYRQIYVDSDQRLKDAASEQDMLGLLGAVHTKLGKFQTGKQIGWNVNFGTGGKVTTLTLESQYERGKATETFLYSGDEPPKLIGYNINSNDMMIR